MIADTVAGGHDAGVGDLDVRSCPDGINRRAAMEERRADPLSSKGPDHLNEIKPISGGERLPYRLLVNVLVGVEAYDEAIALLPPCFQLCDKVLPKLPARACLLLASAKEITPVFLVSRTQSFPARIARVVSAHFSLSIHWTLERP